MSESKRQSRLAQDTLVLLGLVLAGLGLAIAGPLLPIPFLGLIGLPLGLAAAIAFALLSFGLGGFEVPWWRQLAGLAVAAGALFLLGHAYLEGLGTIAEHFLDRAGAPPLSDLWRSVPWVGFGATGLAGSIVLRRPDARGIAPALAASVIAGTSVALGWGLLIVLALWGIPLGA
ncbi:MAG: hypothetical protein KC619_21945 [Myxococcales bacterium]|nr:hypothetical protein [Myxococcales bacterium]